MELKVVASSPTVLRIALSGKLDVQGEEQIGDQFRQLVDLSSTSVLVDMTQVSYLASLGIRMLFAGAKSLAAKGMKIVVLSPQSMVEETLMTSGTVRLIPIAHDEDEALKFL